MKSFVILMDKETEAVALVKNLESIMRDYLNWETLFIGTNRQCLEYVHEWWIENYVPDENRILLKHG